VNEIKPWDLGYYSEKLKQKLFDYDEEEFRPYFEQQKVTEGLFKHAEKLFGIEAKESKDYPVYHEDVKTYEVFDKDSGDFYGVLYVDLYPRDEKKSGAWMNPMRDRGFNKDGGIDCPLVSIVCNFTKPTKDEPALLSLGEVETFFHEFGHAMHAMLTKVEHKSVAGASVLWDFVELPSQIMENWLVYEETFDLFARDYKTGKKIPSDLLKKMKDAQNFMAGNFMLRQASLGLLDMAWHTTDPATIKDVVEFEDEAVKSTALMPRERPSCTSTSFGHIFAGGYSAGYYSYFWAEVLDADAFEEFLTNGLYDEKTGRNFRDKILARGGSADPMELFKDFKGREPDPDSLLRKKGLLPPKP
jgi:peptidyl-dipeptidase Dcp